MSTESFISNMNKWHTPLKWIRLGIISFLIVAILGAIMRYKIGFSLPYFNQKYLQHVHSHFAFSGWISQVLWAWIAYNIGGANFLGTKKIQILLLSHFMVAIGMLISFTIQGYGVISIIFSSASIITSIFLVVELYNKSNLSQKTAGTLWYKASFLWFIVSTVGTFWLIIMMIQKNIPQHAYLSSIYGYLHFQYNGWFFFACTGILLQFLEKNELLVEQHSLKKSWLILSLTCIPAYGLSILWLNLPIYLYTIVAIAATFQLLGWIHLLKQIHVKAFLIRLSKIQKTLLVALVCTVSLKFTLQSLSVIPAVSQLAFGIRPIVIAYLHLVLLGIISLFIIFQATLENWIKQGSVVIAGIIIFLSGFLLNEVTLASQGITSFFYILIPQIEAILFFASILLVTGVLLINIGQLKK